MLAPYLQLIRPIGKFPSSKRLRSPIHWVEYQYQPTTGDTMTYTVYHHDIGPITHHTAGMRAMKALVWELAESGVTIIIH